MENVRCFLTHIEWRQDSSRIGGITWLELYIMSIFHGGKLEANPMSKTIPLQTAITFFKRTRMVALHCVAKQDEWHCQTCQARSNRLEELAISNRHAAIRGMPKMIEQDAKRVTAAILAMRGVNQRKQKLIHQDGNLRLHRRPPSHMRAYQEHGCGMMQMLKRLMSGQTI